ncbi:MAG: M20/M25/M40 family metallo-hydrolase [Anaerolineales bacterium]|nr:M20/M25/M40 family metallo-hydrolase [Anaerolineales bacterium]
MKRTALFLLPFVIVLAACAPLAVYEATERYQDDIEEEVYDQAEEGAGIDEPSVEVWDDDYGALARLHLEALSWIGPRLPGSDEEAEAADLIVSVFEEIGYAPELRPFTAIGDDDETLESANVVVVKDGDLACRIVVGAHYDSSDEGLGSDDNASGVAVLLEVAELVFEQSTPCTLVFVAFGAEEAGLLGSYAFVGEMDRAERDNTIAMINLDSIAAGDVPYVYTGADTSIGEWMVTWADANGYALEPIYDAPLADQGEGSADYAAFDQAGIPFAYFEATNWDLGNQDGYTQVDPRYGDRGAIIHTEYDDLAYLDETFPGRVDQHLNLYVAVLFNLLMEYRE